MYDKLLEQIESWRSRQLTLGHMAIDCRLDPQVASQHAALLEQFLPQRNTCSPSARVTLGLIADSRRLVSVCSALSRSSGARGIAEPVAGYRYLTYAIGDVRWLTLVMTEGRACDMAVAYARGPGGTIIVLVPDGTAPLPGRHVLYALRELVVRSLEKAGGMVVHAAGVAFEDAGAVAFVGGRGAGKSSVLVHALGERGAMYLGNDRILLAPGLPPWIGMMPMPVRLGRGTVLASEALSAELATRERVLPQAGASAPHKLPREFCSRVKLELTPSELARALRTETVSSGELALLVFPRIAPDDRVPSERELPPRDIRRALWDTWRSHDDLKPWLVPHAETEDARRRRVERLHWSLARAVPGVALEFGVGCDPARIRHCLREAVQRRS